MQSLINISILILIFISIAVFIYIFTFNKTKYKNQMFGTLLVFSWLFLSFSFLVPQTPDSYPITVIDTKTGKEKVYHNATYEQTKDHYIIDTDGPGPKETTVKYAIETVVLTDNKEGIVFKK